MIKPLELPCRVVLPAIAHYPDTDERFSVDQLLDHVNGCEEQIDHLVDVEIAARDKRIEKLEAANDSLRRRYDACCSIVRRMKADIHGLGIGAVVDDVTGAVSAPSLGANARVVPAPLPVAQAGVLGCAASAVGLGMLGGAFPAASAVALSDGKAELARVPIGSRVDANGYIQLPPIAPEERLVDCYRTLLALATAGPRLGPKNAYAEDAVAKAADALAPVVAPLLAKRAA